jgi:hypothetical protein
MEPEGSLLCSQEPTTSTYPKSHESSPHPPSPFKMHSNVILPSTPRSEVLCNISSGAFPNSE